MTCTRPKRIQQQKLVKDELGQHESGLAWVDEDNVQSPEHWRRETVACAQTLVVIQKLPEETDFLKELAAHNTRGEALRE